MNYDLIQFKTWGNDRYPLVRPWEITPKILELPLK